MSKLNHIGLKEPMQGKKRTSVVVREPSQP